ncbi:MAG TPA: rod shape-determining protein MreC [Candidatus Baltobacteraceae bacterium]|nr:rod shape-determining protein MreC [Candidatus Baltobacteraceae bacterium]
MAATLALVQINAERAGTISPLASIATSLASFAESASTIAIDGGQSAVHSVISLPMLERENAQLREQNRALSAENARLHELAAQYASEVSIRPAVDLYPKGIEARVIGFPPEDDSRTVTIDRGSNAGVRTDDGVIASGGVVGRVASVGPLSSEVVLITDYTSRIPAITRQGRYWGIARGNLSSVRVEYIPQDAPLKTGETIVTGAGRSFQSGVPIGTIVSIERSDAALYQTAVLRPAVKLGALDRVVVLPH